MSNEISSLLSEFAANEGASKADLQAVGEQFADLPSAYLEFMQERDGGEGFIGENYCILWRLAELRQLNLEYEVDKYAPGLTLFGSSGGGEGFGFDSQAPGAVVVVPFVGMERSAVRKIAASFPDFINALAVKEPDELF